MPAAIASEATAASGAGWLPVDGKVVAAKDPAGRPIYWYTVVPIEGAEEASDLYAVQHGFVSMTPLRLDLTDHQQLGRAKSLEQIRFA